MLQSPGFAVNAWTVMKRTIASVATAVTATIVALRAKRERRRSRRRFMPM